MTTDDARALLQQVLAEIVPDADLSAVPADADLRAEFELDSLDFVELIERLAKRIGARIEEDDYDELRTPDSAAHFLAGLAGGGPAGGR